MKMLLLKIGLFGLLIAQVFLDKTKFPEWKFQQNDYEFEFQRIELVNYSKPYVKNYHIRTYKYNRTCPVADLTYEYGIDLNYDLEIIIQAHTFLSNEYRPFPMRFEVNFCHALFKNYGGFRDFFKCGNFTECPIKKDRIYHVCKWRPDPSQFPPFIPNGDYMLEYQGLYHNIELFTVRGYGRIYRPILIPQ